MPTPEPPVTTPKVPWPTSTAEEPRFERHPLLSREDESPALGRTPPPDPTPPGLDEIIAILARGVQRAIEASAASPRTKSSP